MLYFAPQNVSSWRDFQSRTPVAALTCVYVLEDNVDCVKRVKPITDLNAHNLVHLQTMHNLTIHTEARLQTGGLCEEAASSFHYDCKHSLSQRLYALHIASCNGAHKSEAKALRACRHQRACSSGTRWQTGVQVPRQCQTRGPFQEHRHEISAETLPIDMNAEVSAETD